MEPRVVDGDVVQGTPRLKSVLAVVVHVDLIEGEVASPWPNSRAVRRPRAGGVFLRRPVVVDLGIAQRRCSRRR
jgi:hypothetical protein